MCSFKRNSEFPPESMRTGCRLRIRFRLHHSLQTLEGSVNISSFALCIFDKPLRLNQLKQHRKNEYRGAPAVAEQHPTVISRPTHRNRVVPQNTQKRLQLKHLTRRCSQTTWRSALRLSRRLHQLKG